MYSFLNSKVTHNTFNEHMNKLVQAIYSIIEKHSHSKRTTRIQKRLQQKPWITKGMLVSIKNKQKLYTTVFI